MADLQCIRGVDLVDDLWRNSEDRKFPGWYSKASEYFVQYVEENGAWDLNKYQTVDNNEGTLVKFRCMITNQMNQFYQNPTYFDPQSGEDLPTAYRCLHGIGFMEEFKDASLLQTRHYLECIPVPGEQPWIKRGDSSVVTGENVGKVCLIFQDTQPKVHQIVNVIGIFYPKSDIIEDHRLFVIHSEIGNLNHPDVPSSTRIDFPTSLEPFRSSQDNTRASIIGYISECIGNNDLVAEYLFMQLCSTITKRNGDLIVGKLILNIQGVPPELGILFCSRLATCFATLVPRVVTLNVTHEMLHEKRWVPVKDHNADTLSTARLQLANQTNLILNQTGLEEGQLLDLAIRNVQSIMQLLQTQTLFYDYQFCEVAFNVDVPVVLVSETKTFFGVDCSLDVSGVTEDDLTLIPQVTDAQLDDWKKYIAYARELTKVLLVPKSGELMEAIQEDFVTQRQKDSSVVEDTLHFRINLARMIAASHLEDTLSAEHFQKMAALEETRKTIMANRANNLGEM